MSDSQRAGQRWVDWTSLQDSHLAVYCISANSSSIPLSLWTRLRQNDLKVSDWPDVVLETAALLCTLVQGGLAGVTLSPVAILGQVREWIGGCLTTLAQGRRQKPWYSLAQSMSAPLIGLPALLRPSAAPAASLPLLPLPLPLPVLPPCCSCGVSSRLVVASLRFFSASFAPLQSCPPFPFPTSLLPSQTIPLLHTPRSAHYSSIRTTTPHKETRHRRQQTAHPPSPLPDPSKVATSFGISR